LEKVENRKPLIIRSPGSNWTPGAMAGGRKKPVGTGMDGEGWV